MTIDLPEIHIDCEATKTTYWKQTPTPCHEPATHFGILEHSTEDCEASTIAICDDHKPVFEARLEAMQKNVLDHQADGKTTGCHRCYTPLDPEDLGRIEPITMEEQ